MNDASAPPPNGELAPPTWVRYQVLFAACAVAVVGYVHRVGFATVSPDLKRELDLTSEHLGYLMMAFLIAYAGFEVPGGLLGDRWGVRHLLTVLVLGWSLLTGAVALAVALPAIWLLRFLFLLVVRFLFGMLQAGCFPCLSRMMTDWMPLRERGTAQGFIWTSSRLGGATVPLLLGLMLTVYAWEIALGLLMLLGLVWCLIFWPWFRNRPEEMPRANASEVDLILSGRGIISRQHLSWRLMLGNRSVWGLCLMYGCGGFSASFFITMLPDYLQNHRHLTAQQTKLLTSLPLACGVVACVLGGVLSDWIIRRFHSRKWGRRVSAVGLILAGLAMLATIWVNDVIALGLLLCLTFFCNDLNMGPAWAACSDIGERYAGTVGGAMNMIGNLCAALMTVVSGILLERKDVPLEFLGFSVLGRDLLFGIFACSFTMGAFCWLLVDASKPLMVRQHEVSS